MTDPYLLVDEAYAKVRQSVSGQSDAWLFEQTMLTAPSRRAFLSALPIQDGWDILDLGTGFGGSAFDIACQRHCHVRGVDYDSEKLQVSRTIWSILNENDFFNGRGTISFEEGNAYDLPYPDHSFQFVLSRFLFQHLTRPEDALLQLNRVVSRDGYICLIDVDDQLSLTYPASKAYLELMEAYRQLQLRRGGDRLVGRKLAHYASAAGFQVVGTMIQTSAGYSVSEPNSLPTSMLMTHFHRERESLVREGLISEIEFDTYMLELEQSNVGPHFRTNSEVVVIAKKV
ncbi:class I SAM-dependent methyltransferase [Alicyclobacillus ferrooxydans]|uniref:class I SAM-dependent methyltransferase n=1 Tax=Alicyclobacillus ferrooxydans TaxID=471514 RepID=UPI001FE09837|nr:class I SAM-dependent methyltransferase [Alicyclobacillus ferrooxydans]